MIMSTGYVIEMMLRKSELASRRRAMPGYLDGLVIDLGNLYSWDERMLLMTRLVELGIPVEFTYTMRRSSRKGMQELVIPFTELPKAFELLKPHLLPEYYNLFDCE